MKFIKTKTILTKVKYGDEWYGIDYNMNLYRGCPHGCIYCDSRSSCYHIDNFDTLVGKENALVILENELSKKKVKGVVGIGSMSDTYNPYELKYEQTRKALELIAKYNVPVMPIRVEDMRELDMYTILKEALYEFPVVEVDVSIPDWIACLSKDNWLKKIYIDKIKESVIEIDKIKDVNNITSHFENNEYIKRAYLSNVDTSNGIVTITLEAPNELYDQILNEVIGTNINTRADLLSLFQDFNESKQEYDQIKNALQMVKTTGYGVASPTLQDMKLDTPEIIKQGSRYGIRLKAVAPSIHMIRVDVESTFEPIIGSEIQSKELIDYIQKDSETDPDSIWKSEIFGRSLDVIVKEGIQAKLSLMPENVRFKLQQTLSKLVNKGNGNLFAIVI